MSKRKEQQVVNPITKEWFTLDEDFNVWIYSEDMSVGLNITITPELCLGGQVNELRHAVQNARKELKLNSFEIYPDPVVVDDKFEFIVKTHGKIIAKLCKVDSVITAAQTIS